MIPKDLAEQVREEVKGLKEVQDKFLQTYRQIVTHFGGAEWRKAARETLLHQVRSAIIPTMEQEGMEPKAVQALCAWAEKQVMAK